MPPTWKVVLYLAKAWCLIFWWWLTGGPGEESDE